MQLSADTNMQVVQPTTASQIFHLLRRQMVRPLRKPLVVMTPKSLLRHKDAVSSLAELAEGQFRTVIGEVDPLAADKVSRIVLCSGKIYYELVAERRARERGDVAIIRIEQLYPFPNDAFAKEIARYPNAREIVWCQEEPRNQGNWYWFVSRQHLARSLSGEHRLYLVSRAACASPAAGYFALHQMQQKAIIDGVFGELNQDLAPSR